MSIWSLGPLRLGSPFSVSFAASVSCKEAFHPYIWRYRAALQLVSTSAGTCLCTESAPPVGTWIPVNHIFKRTGWTLGLLEGPVLVRPWRRKVPAIYFRRCASASSRSRFMYRRSAVFVVDKTIAVPHQTIRISPFLLLLALHISVRRQSPSAASLPHDQTQQPPPLRIVHGVSSNKQYPHHQHQHCYQPLLRVSLV
jgi:hypothetical protein